MRFIASLAVAALLAPSFVSAEIRDITFPVAGEFSFRNDFSEPRGDGTRSHEGIDIVAAKMTPVVAAVDGTISFIAIPQASWGYSITIRGDDGYSYRYLHLNNDTPGTDDGVGGEAHAYAPDLRRGARVNRGQRIGWVGDSGNAEATVSHLHFEISDSNRNVINPYDSLLAAAGGTGTGVFVAPVTTGDEGSIEAEEQFIATRQLQEGMIDRDVQGLHQELTTLGFYAGAISESYTAETREAVRKFQNAKKLTATGIADAPTRRAILAALKALAPVSSFGSSTSSGSSGLQEGSSGAQVTALQTRLKELGYFTSDVTGYFGPITKKAVIAFQTAKGIEAIGIVGPKTQAALAAASASAPPEATPPGALTPPGQGQLFTLYLEQGMRNEEVRRLQLVLAAEGHFVGEATGYFGSITKAAVVQYQIAKGIEPLGVVGPKTRATLNSVL